MTLTPAGCHSFLWASEKRFTAEAVESAEQSKTNPNGFLGVLGASAVNILIFNTQSF